MGKKFISSKETYFKRQNNPMTLEDWNNFKLANPRPEYLGEICWSLHDSMILRGKPADDSAIVKTLLKEVGVEFEQHVDYLKITSDLTGKDIETVSFVSEENTNIKSVQFVIQTENISVEDTDDAVIEEEETLSFWEKLLQLFKK